MLYNFKTLDDSLFVIDTKNQKWGRASTILASPSISAAENKLSHYVFAEEGELVAMGGGAYSLNGRTPETKGVGEGLSVVGILAVPFDTELLLYLRPNVNIKEDSFLSGFPAEFIKNVRHFIIQPNPQSDAAAQENNG